MPARRRILSLATGLGLVGSALLLVPPAAQAVGPGLVISEVYGAGGTTNGLFRSDFIELHNTTGDPISLNGLSLQVRAPDASTPSKVFQLNGTVPAGSHYLVKGVDGPVTTKPELSPTPDASSTLALGTSQGQVLLVDGVVPFSGAGNLAGNPGLLDMVGYGPMAAGFEGTPAPGIGGSKSATRDVNGTDTDNNGPDFQGFPPAPQNCDCPVSGGGAMPIADIQGTGMTSPELGFEVTTPGVVTASYPAGGLSGFFMQTEGTGGGPVDPSTRTASDGIFVRQPLGSVTVMRGAHVGVTGTVTEVAGQTQINAPNAAAVTVVAGTPDPVVPVTASSWPDTNAEKEALEGMLFTPAGNFTVSDNSATHQFGELGLARGTSPLIQPTQVGPPGSPAADVAAADNAARAITLDDGASTNYLATSNTAAACGTRPRPCLTNGHRTPPYISNTTPIRVGATGTFHANVILTQGGTPTAPTYRFQPLTTVLGPPAGAGAPASFGNTRTDEPDADLIAADGAPAVKVASFNVRDFFTTLGDPDNDNRGGAGCTAFADRTGDGNHVGSGCGLLRGAWDPQDLARQRIKLVAAINALDADVVGLMDVENSLKLDGSADEATKALVTALNADAGAGTWAANPSSAELPVVSQMDVVTNAIIYKPATVSRLGPARALGDESNSADSGDAFANAREPIAQNFVPVGGSPFLVVVNHFADRDATGPLAGDADSGDGQAAANASRVSQATELAEWIPSVQGAVDDVVMLGDFNAYAQEDPMQVLYDEGYTNLAVNAGIETYSYSSAGRSGSVDHVLANATALERFTGADVWNVNSVEPQSLDYRLFNVHATNFHDGGPYRSSDHDPVVVGLEAGQPFDPVATTMHATAAQMTYGRVGSVRVTVAPDAASGTVTVLDGAHQLGTAKVTDGVANVAVPGTALPPGSHPVTVLYGGNAAYVGSQSQATLVVAKATARLSLHRTPAKVVARKTRTRLNVGARATGVVPGGRVEVRWAAKLLKAGSLRSGSVRLTLPKFTSVGRKILKVRYLGSTRIRPVTSTYVVRVKRR